MVRIRAYMDTDVAVETDWVNANGEGKEEEEEDKNGKLHPFYRHLRFLERRLPCHMYLNGCPRKKNCSIPSLFLPFIFFLILRF